VKNPILKTNQSIKGPEGGSSGGALPKKQEDLSSSITTAKSKEAKMLGILA
jgi:hypothetical protein